jgi:hypothetical protein
MRDMVFSQKGYSKLGPYTRVMPRLGLGIHELLFSVADKLVDPKAKPWGDDE